MKLLVICAWLVVILLLFGYADVFGAPSYVYDYNENCSRAYRYAMAMQFTEARELLRNELKANPKNLAPVYLADYEDCITLLLTCDPAEYEKRKQYFDARLDLLEQGSSSSPWFRFCRAGLYLHWGMVHLRFGEEVRAAIKIRKAFQLLNENEQLFPSFEYNGVYSGLRDAVVGSLPGNYRWLASIFGLRGDLKRGANQLAHFLNTHTDNQPLRGETLLYSIFVRFYLLSDQPATWDLLNSPAFDAQNSVLNAFVKLNIALDYRKAKAAMELLKNVSAANRDQYPIFYYEEGLALLGSGDTAATWYFSRYIEKNKSDLYIKDCWQKMAYAWYINGNTTKAEYCRQQIKRVGSARTDADKQAEKFAASRIWPLRKLLRARLLIDGGYNTEALAILNTINTTELTNPADKAEYFFRMGKVHDALANNNKALEYYQSAINTGKDRHEQFAARAALWMGIIYEHAGMKAQAIAHYKECLDMPSHDFQNAIDNQAKAGLNRLE